MPPMAAKDALKDYTYQRGYASKNCLAANTMLQEIAKAVQTSSATRMGSASLRDAPNTPLTRVLLLIIVVQSKAYFRAPISGCALRTTS